MAFNHPNWNAFVPKYHPALETAEEAKRRGVRFPEGIVNSIGQQSLASNEGNASGIIASIKSLVSSKPLELCSDEELLAGKVDVASLSRKQLVLELERRGLEAGSPSVASSALPGLRISVASLRQRLVSFIESRANGKSALSQLFSVLSKEKLWKKKLEVFMHLVVMRVAMA